MVKRKTSVDPVLFLRLSNPTLQGKKAYVTLGSRMLTIQKMLPLLLLTVSLTGCVSITNLTPSRVTSTDNGLYPFEAAWHSNQQSLRKDSIKAYVIIEMNSYPMQPTPIVENRWETLVPIPADKKHLSYRYKFDYEYNSIPTPSANSKLSPSYQLEIIRK